MTLKTASIATPIATCRPSPVPALALNQATAKFSTLSGLPPLVLAPNPAWSVPNREECTALWEKYEIPDHIREHSRLVAEFAVQLAEQAVAQGAQVHVPSVLAAGLLHDIGKYYTILHGGNHAQLGGAWVLNETRHPHNAQGVIHNVRWS